MANELAIAATSKAILGLLEDAWPTSSLASSPAGTPGFELFHGSDFENPTASPPKKSVQDYGVSLYLYRVAVSGTMRPASKQLKGGKYYRAPLMLDLHYLLTAWANDVESQQRLLGWCLRVLYETPILPATHINKHSPDHGVFRLDENVELIPDSLSLQDFAAIWDKLKPKMQTSISYLARMVALEADHPLTEATPVQTREFAFDDAP